MKEPVRLRKKESVEDKIEKWIYSHFTILFFLTISILLLTIIYIFYIIVGLSAVESRALNNFINMI